MRDDFKRRLSPTTKKSLFNHDYVENRSCYRHFDTISKQQQQQNLIKITFNFSSNSGKIEVSHIITVYNILCNA